MVSLVTSDCQEGLWAKSVDSVFFRKSPNLIQYDHTIQVLFLDQELLSYRSSSCRCCCCSCCWPVGATVLKKPKAPSFQVASGWNLAGLFVK